MNIAAITLTYNDNYKIKEWIENYCFYKDDIKYHIIVDNASETEYKEKLAESFPNAIIIHRKTNGGCSGAYNDGVRYALNNTDADAIAIIGNDIRPESDCLRTMYDYLMSNKKLGMVSSVLLSKNSDVVEDFGVKMKGFRSVFYNAGETYDSLGKRNKIVDIVPGGFNIAKREFYEKAGLLDEKLFMYCEELDTMYRSRKAGWKCGVTSKTYAWHWHINPPSAGKERHPETRYMIGRNKVYLTKKYDGMIKGIASLLFVCVSMTGIQIFHYLKERKKIFLENARYTFIGGFYGFLGKMDPNKYSLPRE